MQGVMVNRKLFGNFEFSAPLQKRSIFLLFDSLLFLLFRIIYRKQKQKRKSRIFAVFAVIRPFLSQIKYWFSVVYSYIGQTTPYPPRFWHSQGGSALVRNFLFFIFYFFCKILCFFKFRFSTEF